MKKKSLIEKIYQTLKTENRFLHYKQIWTKIADGIDKDVKLSSLEETLSHTSHLFNRHSTSRGLWGLAEWSGKNREIERNSLLLAISEEDWVYRILKESSRPLTTKEIAREITNLFIINTPDFIETTFINPNDSRLVKLTDASWGLKEWVDGWREELGRIEPLLKKIFDQKKGIEKIRMEKDSMNKKLLFLENMKRKYSSPLESLASDTGIVEEELKKNRKEMTDKKIRLFEMNNGIDRLKSKIDSLGHKNRIHVIIFLFSVIAFIATYEWYHKPISFIFGFSFIVFASYSLLIQLKRNKLRNSLATQFQERAELVKDLVKFKKQELFLKVKLNQKKIIIECKKRELGDIDVEMIEVKKSIENLAKQESKFNQVHKAEIEKVQKIIGKQAIQIELLKKTEELPERK